MCGSDAKTPCMTLRQDTFCSSPGIYLKLPYPRTPDTVDDQNPARYSKAPLYERALAPKHMRYKSRVTCEASSQIRSKMVDSSALGWSSPV